MKIISLFLSLLLLVNVGNEVYSAPKIFNLTTYGGNGDGSTNNDTAIAAWIVAADAVNNNPDVRVRMECDPGEYYFQTAFQFPSYVDVHCDPSTFYYDNTTDRSQPAITWRTGPGSADDEGGYFGMLAILTSYADGTWPNTSAASYNFVGLRVHDGERAIIRVPHIAAFNTCFELRSTDDQVFKNVMTLNHLIGCRGIRIHSETDPGFINGNDFDIGPNCQPTGSASERGNTHCITFAATRTVTYDNGSALTEGERIWWGNDDYGGHGVVDSQTGTTTGTITFSIMDGYRIKDNDMITGLTSGNTITASADDDNLGYVGANKHTTWGGSLQMGIPTQWMASTPITRGDQWEYQGWMYEAHTTGTTGTTPPTHTGGIDSDGLINWLFLGPALRSGMHYNYAGTENKMIATRDEGHYGPLVTTMDEDYGQDNEVDILYCCEHFKNVLWPQYGFANVSDHHEFSQMGGKNFKLTGPAFPQPDRWVSKNVAESMIIGQSDQVVANHGLIMMDNISSRDLARTIDEPTFKMLSDGVIMGDSMVLGYLFESENVGGAKLNFIPLPGGDRENGHMRFRAGAFDRNFEEISPGAGQYPIQVFSSNQSGWFGGDSVLQDNNGSNWPRQLSNDGTLPYTFMGIGIEGVFKGLTLTSIIGLNHQPEERLYTSDFNSVFYDALIKPAGFYHDEHRATYGEPTVGIFLSVSEYLVNLDDVTPSAPFGYYVNSAGYKAPVAVDGGSYRYHEMVSDGGEIYHRVNTEMTLANISGTFADGDTITWARGSGEVIDVAGSTINFVMNTPGRFPIPLHEEEPGELITSSSGATGQITSPVTSTQDGCGGNLISKLDGNNPSTNLEDSAKCVWRWIGHEATFTPTTQTR